MAPRPVLLLGALLAFAAQHVPAALAARAMQPQWPSTSIKAAGEQGARLQPEAGAGGLGASPAHDQDKGIQADSERINPDELEAAWSRMPLVNQRPLIGVLTQPCEACPGKSYIAAAFVKWIEAAGGRPVPIRFYASEQELYRIFRQINAIVFPGGLTWLWLDAPYVVAARKLFNWAVESNDAGDPFPIHGTCLGFQLLHILASDISRNDLLVDTDSTSHATTLNFVGDAAKHSNMFRDLPTRLIESLESDQDNIALENHMYGMPPPMYEKYPVLSEWYRVLTTTKDRNGIEYISSMEGRKYPFFGTQWHPEKPPYEFGLEEVPHSVEAVKVSQHLGSVLIEAAKRSSHKPESKEQELELLLYDTCPVFSARFEVMDEENYDGPDMTYYFDHKETPPAGPDDDGPGGDGPHFFGRSRVRARHPSGFFMG